jgi:hypothetical protein
MRRVGLSRREAERFEDLLLDCERLVREAVERFDSELAVQRLEEAQARLHALTNAIIADWLPRN